MKVFICLFMIMLLVGCTGNSKSDTSFSDIKASDEGKSGSQPVPPDLDNNSGSENDTVVESKEDWQLPEVKDPENSKSVEIKVTAKKWEFQPSTIEVNKGDHVKLIIESIDVDHGIFIKDFNVKEDLKAGTTTVVEFDAEKEGEFTFFCSVFCGENHKSMTGKLVVR